MTSFRGYEMKTVSELVRELPGRARLFEDFGIDYCCGGGKSLAEACVTAEVPLDEVSRKLQEFDAGQSTADETNQADWTQRPLSELIDHIVETHHAYLREELPRLGAGVDRIVAAHGEDHPELREVRMVFSALSAELEAHMMKEEEVLFPMIRQLEAQQSQAGAPVESELSAFRFHCGSIGNPIWMMEYEHQSAGEALKRMRRLTDGFRVPPDGCVTYQRVMEGLRDLEFDLHRHIHKENNILFPRAMELESAAAV